MRSDNLPSIPLLSLESFAYFLLAGDEQCCLLRDSLLSGDISLTFMPLMSTLALNLDFLTLLSKVPPSAESSFLMLLLESIELRQRPSSEDC